MSTTSQQIRTAHRADRDYMGMSGERSRTVTSLNAEQGSGFYKDLESLLKGEIAATPEDPRLKVKLLEVYFESRNKEPFLELANKFNCQHSRSKNPDLWVEVVRMGRELLPEEPLFDNMANGLDLEVPSTSHRFGGKRFGEDEKYKLFFESLSAHYQQQQTGRGFTKKLDRELRHVLSRPSSLMHAAQLSEHLGGAQIYLKREDLSPSHNYLHVAITGQALLAREMGKNTLVTASANGFRGAIVASIARRMGMQALVFVNQDMIEHQPANMQRLELMGAEVHSVDEKILRHGDLREVALEYCLRESQNSFLLLGLDGAPHPYPQIVMESEAVIGREVMQQIYQYSQRLPELLVARHGNNADALGFFAPFMKLTKTRLACVRLIEEIGDSIISPTKAYAHNMPMHQRGLTPNQRHTAKNILEALDYPSVQREHAWLKATGRLEYPNVTASQVRQAVRDFSHYEGFIPAVETAHALAFASYEAKRMRPDESVVVLVAERVDKDMPQIEALMSTALN